MATGDLRPLPDFLIVGAKRGGTTSLWRYLNEHDGVLTLFPKPEKIKGLYFFDENFGRGERWYRSHFPTRAIRTRSARRLGHPVVAGEASPYYLYHPLAPLRARHLAPDALIIVSLRDPGRAGVLALQGAPHQRHRAAVVPGSDRGGAGAARGRGAPDRRRRGVREPGPPTHVLRRPGPVRTDAEALVRRLRPGPGHGRDQRGDVRRPAGDGGPGHGAPRPPVPEARSTRRPTTASPTRASTPRCGPASPSSWRRTSRRSRRSSAAPSLGRNR